jgi:hypothetical protein
MSEPKNLILEQLSLLRNEAKAHGAKMDEQFQAIHLRLHSIEERLTRVERAILTIHSDIGLIHSRLDSRNGRENGTERRLEFREGA